MSLDTLIADTRKAIVGDAANAQAVFTAQGTLVGVTEVDISTSSHTFQVDEPPALGGADAAANQVQDALASLGSCQAITYRFWAAQLGAELDSITVRVEGDLDLRGLFGVDDAVRPGLTAVRVEVTVDGRRVSRGTPNWPPPWTSTARSSTYSRTLCRSPARSPPRAEVLLAVALDGAGWHPAAWREPDAQPQRLFTAGYWTELARQAERGLLDFLTIEDGWTCSPTTASRPTPAPTGSGAVWTRC